MYLCWSPQQEDWSKDTIPSEITALLGGMTALQIACSRDDNYFVC